MATKKPVETCGPVKLRHAVSVCIKKRDIKPSAPIRGSNDVCRYLKGAQDLDRESFYALHLNTRGQVIGAEEVAKGTASGVEVHPRETFKSAILNNANAVILAHNHPSGNPEPSRDDFRLTQRLAEAGELLGVPVRDHVVVGAESCKGIRGSAEADGYNIPFHGAPMSRPRGARKGVLQAVPKAADRGLGAKKDESSHIAKKTVEWFVGGILAVTIGGVFWWKWNQISSSGVPLDFALRRTFSRRFFEGYLGLQSAWERKQKRNRQKVQQRSRGQTV